MQYGQVIEVLRSMPGDKPIVMTRDGEVFKIGSLESWRGIYAEPTLTAAGRGYSGADPYNHAVGETVTEVLHYLESQQYTFRQGWKGGYYEMRPSSLLWADDEGIYQEQQIVRVRHEVKRVVLVAQRVDDGPSS